MNLRNLNTDLLTKLEQHKFVDDLFMKAEDVKEFNIGKLIVRRYPTSRWGFGFEIMPRIVSVKLWKLRVEFIGWKQ